MALDNLANAKVLGGFRQAVAEHLDAFTSTRPADRMKQIELIAPEIQRLHGDARHIALPGQSVDLVVTSPPYWKKRDYGFPDQIGQEATPDEYVQALLECMAEWRRLLTPSGSIFLNVGDTYWKRSLASIPGRLEIAAAKEGWILRNRIIWAKGGGIPDPTKNRLSNRHEYILHFTASGDYYYDLVGYAEKYGNGANPGDVWALGKARNMGDHLAPFPTEIVERAIVLACPTEVCTRCGHPRTRLFQRTAELNPSRPQAKRAMQLAKEMGLTDAHILAIQATGISDAGKALRVQTGTDKNSKEVKRLALEAKKALGGYFREFTFAKKKTVGWTRCKCGVPFRPGTLLDPFMGSGTALKVAARLSRGAIGVDMAPRTANEVWGE